jgi:hypothetical protein
VKKKGVSINELRSAVEAAWGEVLESIERGGIAFDYASSNCLVLDYNPKSKKVLLAIVDHGGSVLT